MIGPAGRRGRVGRERCPRPLFQSADQRFGFVAGLGRRVVEVGVRANRPGGQEYKQFGLDGSADLLAEEPAQDGNRREDRDSRSSQFALGIGEPAKNRGVAVPNQEPGLNGAG